MADIGKDLALGLVFGGLGVVGYLSVASKPSIEEIKVLPNQLVLTIKNNSLLPKSFYVGATFVNGPVGGQGCGLNAQGNPYYDLPAQHVSIPPLGTATVTFQYSEVPFTGLVNLIIKFWGKYNQTGNVLAECFYGASYQVYL